MQLLRDHSHRLGRRPGPLGPLSGQQETPPVLLTLRLAEMEGGDEPALGDAAGAPDTAAG